MKTENKLSFSIIRKIVFISLILIMMFGIGVIATNSELTNVTIEFSDKYQIEVVTSKVKVADILNGSFEGMEIVNQEYRFKFKCGL